jgi:hypothetical protein
VVRIKPDSLVEILDGAVELQAGSFG